MYRYLKRVEGAGTGKYIQFWNSKGLSNENITAPTTSDYSLNPQCYLGNKTRVAFKGSCLKQDKITYTHGRIVSIYIAYEISKNVNPIQDGLFRGCSQMGVGGGGWQKGPPFYKICHTYPTMMKLGRVITQPKEIQKIYESGDKTLEFC